MSTSDSPPPWQPSPCAASPWPPAACPSAPCASAAPVAASCGVATFADVPGEEGEDHDEEGALHLLLRPARRARHREEGGERGEARDAGADGRGAAVRTGREGEPDDDGGEGRGGDLVLHGFLFLVPSTVLKKLMKPAVIPTSAPSIVSHGTVFPSFWSSQYPSPRNAPTATTRLVEAA